jgi:hypothetical protein
MKRAANGSSKRSRQGDCGFAETSMGTAWVNRLLQVAPSSELKIAKLRIRARRKPNKDSLLDGQPSRAGDRIIIGHLNIPVDHGVLKEPQIADRVAGPLHAVIRSDYRLSR